MFKVASLTDLSGMKAAVVQKRAQAKGYLDIDALMRPGGVNLPPMLAAPRAIYARQFEPHITVKALTYFGDGDLGTVARATQMRLKKSCCCGGF